MIHICGKEPSNFIKVNDWGVDCLVKEALSTRFSVR